MRKALFILVVLLVGCERDQPKGAHEQYPQDIRQSFIQGCLDEEISRAACNCWMEGIEDKYVLGGFLTIAAEMGEGEKMPKRMKNILMVCLNKEKK